MKYILCLVMLASCNTEPVKPQPVCVGWKTEKIVVPAEKSCVWVKNYWGIPQELCNLIPEHTTTQEVCVKWSSPSNNK